MDVRAFRPGDTDAVVALWERCGLTRPWNDPRRDIERKLNEQPELFLVGTVQGEPIASAMAGFDGHRGWLYYLAVHPNHRGAGHARALVEEIERTLTMRGVPKLNLQVRDDNLHALAFWKAMGYTREHNVSLGRRLIPDGPS
ncbi:MAG: GNAT family acetyltransferase [Micrococcales bacterium]|nr:GNAT family acetyltransferase [Micrococcales bacterium]